MFYNESANATPRGLSSPDHAFDRLLPTLVECFGVMLAGFVAGRLGVLSKVEWTGLNYFAANFALPSMIFLNLARLDVATEVHWAFVSGILASKALVFVAVAAVALLAGRPTDYGAAAIFAIFATHVNDFGLAYPILQSVYGETHPAYPNYIYLIGLISLAILNPIGFLMIEAQRARGDTTTDVEKFQTGETAVAARQCTRARAGRVCSMLLSIAKRTVTNPNVFMTVFGALANVAFKRKLPEIVTGILKNFGDTFQGTVLFLLGLEVARTKSTKNSNYLVPGLLLAVKMLLSPLVTRGAVKLFCSDSPEVQDLSDYGFLYGTVPTAPVVLVYAAQFGMVTDTLAVALVACTFVSGPIMYVSARMLVVQAYDILEYMKQLRETILCLAAIGIFSCLWVVFLLVISRRWKKPPHLVLLLLVFSQVVMSLGLLMWSSAPLSLWTNYLQMSAVTGGQLSARFWTVILAIVLFLTPKYTPEDMKRLLPYFAIVGFGLPAVAVLCLLVTTHPDKQYFHGSDVIPSFLFGDTEACMAVVVLSFCLVTTCGCLLLFHRQRSNKQITNTLQTTPSPESDSSVLSTIQEESAKQLDEQNAKDQTIQKLCIGTLCTITLGGTDNREVPNHQTEEFPSKRRKKSLVGVSNPLGLNKRMGLSVPMDAWTVTEHEQKTLVLEPKEIQASRHFTLLLFLCVSMVVGLTTSIWKLLAERRTGIFVALEFLDIILNFGQPVLVAIIFGHDLDIIIVPVVKTWQKWKANRGHRATEKENTETHYVCFQFLTYHYRKCIQQLPRDKIWKKKHHVGVFWGWELVDWILRQGLCKSRGEAVTYASHLYNGGILHSVNNKQTQFQDGPYFYRLNSEVGNG